MQLYSPFEKLQAEVAEIAGASGGSVFFYHVHISLMYKYIYVETPKVGCSSIKMLLQQIELQDPTFYLAGEYVHHRNYSPLLSPAQVGSLKRLLVGPRKLYLFCFVRNPFTRLLSAYLDKIARNKPEKRKITQALGVPDELFYDALSFEDFVEAIFRYPDKTYDSHWAVQQNHLRIGLIDYDFIGRFERLQNDMEKVLRTLGVNPRFSVARHGYEQTRAESMLQRYYTPPIVKKVVQIYETDFERFDYGKAPEVT